MVDTHELGRDRWQLKRQFSTAFSLAIILAIIPSVFSVVWLFQQIFYPKVASCDGKKVLVSNKGHFRICYQEGQSNADEYGKKLGLYLEKTWDFLWAMDTKESSGLPAIMAG
jgi:hypothetical protein